MFLGVFGRVCLDKIRIWIGRLSKAEYPPKRRWASFNPLGDWWEQRSRGRENLPSGWWTGNTGLLLPLNWDLHQQLLCFWGLRVTLRSTPSDLGVSMLQMAGCGASQLPQSFKSVPYGRSPFCVSGELRLILCVNRRVSCKQWEIWLLSLEYINLIWWNIKKVWR